MTLTEKIFLLKAEAERKILSGYLGNQMYYIYGFHFEVTSESHQGLFMLFHKGFWFRCGMKDFAFLIGPQEKLCYRSSYILKITSPH